MMNADRIARLYRWFEYLAFGRALERRRFAYLSQLRGCRRALILGEGDGRFLAALLERNRELQADVVDSSARMLELARCRIPAGAEARVRLRHLDARVVESPACSYDLVVTHFFLDCFSDSDAGLLIGRLTEALQPGGLWVLSEFQEPRGGLARLHARVWLGVMYRFFQITTGLDTSKLPPYAELLRAREMRLESGQSERFGLMVSQLWRKP